MAKRLLRSALVSVLVVTSALTTAGLARADVSNASGTNVQDGSNRGTTNQSGSGKSGDAVGGQVSGVVSSGRTSVDARNTSRDSDVTTGDANGSNTANSFTGQNSSVSSSVGVPLTADITDSSCAGVFGCNIQDGNNSTTINQTASATTGDGVAGQVIGAVTAGGGSTSIVAANNSSDSSVETGDADTANNAAAFTGLSEAVFAVVGTTDFSGISCESAGFCSLQDGSNRTTARQTSSAVTGDGVAGQVIGSVSAGATSIDASNTSTGVDVTTGDAESANDGAFFTGEEGAVIFAVGNFEGLLQTEDVNDSSCSALGCNVQDGSNTTTSNQSASAVSGDGVAGEVIGGVTAAGGSLSIVASNTSRDSSVDTGDADANNEDAAFTGLSNAVVAVVLSDIEDNFCGAQVGCELQDGSNRTSARQVATASTGDGVAGQVIGAVAAGATSIDARNTSDGVDVATGDAEAGNEAAFFTGLDASVVLGVANLEAVPTSDVNDNECAADFCNIQDGNNRTSYSQSASASSGDGVAGEVIGAVTSAGGSASIVAANTSTNSDVDTGDSSAENDAAAFVGLNDAVVTLVVAADVNDSSCADTAFCNIQDGNNSLTGSQTARAATGDGVAGQVLGVVSAGAASVDATNRTDDSSVETGDADARNSAAEFVGLNSSLVTFVGPAPADVNGATGTNVQDGSNRKTETQSADATSGDAIAGQVTGVVTSAGGSASVVVANTSTGIDSTSGDSDFVNTDSGFVGLAFGLITSIGGLPTLLGG